MALRKCVIKTVVMLEETGLSYSLDEWHGKLASEKMHHLPEMTPKHNLLAGKASLLAQDNSASIATHILRAGKQCLIKRSFRLLCEYKYATTTSCMTPVADSISAVFSRPVNLIRKAWIISHLGSRAKAAFCFDYTLGCVSLCRGGRVTG